MSHDFLGVVIVLGEDQCLRDVFAAGKEFGGQRVAIGFEDRADLVRRDDGTVEVALGVDEIGIKVWYRSARVCLSRIGMV